MRMKADAIQGACTLISWQSDQNQVCQTLELSRLDSHFRKKWTTCGLVTEDTVDQLSFRLNPLVCRARYPIPAATHNAPTCMASKEALNHM